MSKRKNKDPGAAAQLHPTRSFDQYVADATLARLSGYIDGEIQGLGQALAQRNQQTFANILTRLVATEEVLAEKLGVTKDDLANRVAAIQDRSDGLELVTGSAIVGDRIRLEIKTRTADQTEYQGTSRMQIDNLGSGQTIGKELECAIIGMTAGETKEVLFGKDNSLSASLSLNRVSRRPAPAKTEEAAAAQEAPNADSDAG